MKMRYVHDCTLCVPMGQHNEFDLYYCKEGNCGVPTVIARFGNEGSEYISGLLNTEVISHRTTEAAA